MKKETYKKQGFTITERTDLFDEEYGMTPHLSAQLDELFWIVKDKNESENAIERIQRLIFEYPRCPILKNYLSMVYRTRGDIDTAEEINERIIAEYPNYLYGKISKAASYIENDEPAKILEVLGEELSLKKLYPDREVFFLHEISSFLEMTILYYNAIGNKKKKGKQLGLLEKIHPEKVGEVLKMVENRNMIAQHKEMVARWDFENDKDDEEREEIALPTSHNTIPPTFNHPQINRLYEYGEDIPMDMIHEILALPRKSLIADLELVLEDAVDRYNYFETQEWKNNIHTFPLHAIYLLMELKAEESLHAVLSLFTNNNKLLDSWFGDLITETLWQCFLIIGFNDLQSMKQFLLTPQLNAFTKCPVTEAFSQIALHYPERRDEIIEIYSDILNYYISTPPEESDVDPSFLGLLIGDIIDARLEELLPSIKILYEMNFVGHSMNGDYSATVRHMNKKRDYKRKIETLEGLYRFSFGSLNVSEFEKMLDKKLPLQEPPKKSFVPAPVASNIGRNDPCPCGSGKKYKKCCLS